MHATFHRAANGLVGVEMRRHVGSGILGLFNDRYDFFNRKPQEMDRVRWRRNTAICHDLNEFGAALQFFAGSAPNLGNAVADTAKCTKRETATTRRLIVVGAAIVAMSAGLRQRLAEMLRRGVGQKPSRVAATRVRWPRRRRARW